jgi:hypothetical protein
METSLPRWSVRLNAARPPTDPGFHDLIPLVAHHYKLHAQAVDFLGPYNAKQRGPGSVYLAPSKDQLRAAIRQGSVNDFTYAAFITSLERFCQATKGQRALPTPHPSVIHSIQLPLPAFELRRGGGDDTIIQLIGVEVPLIVKALRFPEEVKFIIVRPRLSKLGTASAKDWEVLFFKQALGYIPDWADTSINPRYSGIW